LEKAVIFNVMRYSVHDGPGIRTTVFFKGCPLACLWCHNPEGIDQKPQNVFNPAKCIKCGQCADRTGDTDKAGSDICPTGARETIGYEITIPALMREINKDRLFYEQSGGGVTFSGGEPFFQGEFLLKVLARCREDHISAAIDTSSLRDTRLMQEAAKTAGYFLYDIKFMDSEKHEKYWASPTISS